MKCTQKSVRTALIFECIYRRVLFHWAADLKQCIQCLLHVLEGFSPYHREAQFSG